MFSQSYPPLCYFYGDSMQRLKSFQISEVHARVHVWSSLIKPSWTERLRASSQLHRWSSLSGKVSTWQPAGEAGRVGPQRRTEAGQRRAHQGQNRLSWTRPEPTWAEQRPKVTETETKTKPRGKNKSRKIQQAEQVLMRARKTKMDLQSTVFRLWRRRSPSEFPVSRDVTNY